MKNYQKPTVNIESVVASEMLSNFASWLEGAEKEYQNATITTFELAS